MDRVHGVDKIEVATDGSHESWIGSDFLVEISNDADGAVMLCMDGKFLFEVVYRLESGIWRAVTTLP
jgi:hypothetical protein